MVHGQASAQSRTRFALGLSKLASIIYLPLPCTAWASVLGQPLARRDEARRDEVWDVPKSFLPFFCLC